MAGEDRIVHRGHSFHFHAHRHGSHSYTPKTMKNMLPISSIIIKSATKSFLVKTKRPGNLLRGASCKNRVSEPENVSLDCQELIINLLYEFSGLDHFDRDPFRLLSKSEVVGNNFCFNMGL